MNAKVDSWRTPKEKPRASLGGPGYANMFEGPDQELAAQLERCHLHDVFGLDCACPHLNSVKMALDWLNCLASTALHQ